MSYEKHLESFLHKFCESLSTLEKRYEFEGDKENPVSRSTRFTSDSVVYISLLVQAFIADIIEQSRKFCGNKKTLDTSHIQNFLKFDKTDSPKDGLAHSMAILLQHVEDSGVSVSEEGSMT